MAFELKTLEKAAAEAVATLDVTEALRLMRQIAPHGDMGRIDDALLALYLEMSFVRLPQLSVPEAMKLFKEHVLLGLNIEGFDLGARVYDRLAITFEEEDRVTFIREMLRNIEIGTEQLGSGLVVLDKPVAPTVENWLKEYRVGLSAAKNRTGFDEVTFLNKNSNVQRLSAQQRALLLRLIGLYDGFSNSLREYDAQPEVYLEDNPELEIALINPSPDEWDALSVDHMPGSVPVPARTEDALEEGYDEEVVEEERTDQGVDQANDTVRTEVPPIAEALVPEEGEHSTGVFPSAPNVQGVLVQVPLGASERTGLEVMNSEDDAQTLPHAPQSEEKKRVVLPLPPFPALAKKVVRLEDLKAKAQTKQMQVQEEIEHKLADLKRKP
ncbi:MAG: hypothetical protein KBD66_01335 [Candidatus Doudnabacteria bacterium]|nr:hypothetical protein [Candidatus Doudnabacteria bacterium]